MPRKGGRDKGRKGRESKEGKVRKRRERQRKEEEWDAKRKGWKGRRS